MFERRRGPEPPAKPALTPAARDVLGFAKAEAAALNHHYLGTEHILLALLREANSDAARILAPHADLETMRAGCRASPGSRHSRHARPKSSGLPGGRQTCTARRTSHPSISS